MGSGSVTRGTCRNVRDARGMVVTHGPHLAGALCGQQLWLAEEVIHGPNLLGNAS